MRKSAVPLRFPIGCIDKSLLFGHFKIIFSYLFILQRDVFIVDKYVWQVRGYRTKCRSEILTICK